MKWTWANTLTGLRLAAILPLSLCMLAGLWSWAAVLFGVAVFTDYFDGPLARRMHQATPIGGLFDHATDALFVSSAAATGAWLGHLPFPLSILIISAFAQYVLDSRALAGQKLRGSNLGRYNGIGYFVVVGAVVLGHAFGWWAWLAAPTFWLGWVLAATTVISMLSRAVERWRAR